MYLEVSGYPHPQNEVWFNIDHSVRFSPRGRPEKLHKVWTIMGSLTGTDEADLTAKMQAISNAYVHGVDLKFYGNSGALTHHTLISADTITGTRIEKFRWLAGNPGIWGSGTEYVNKRTYQVIVSADSLVLSDNLYFYRSTLSVTGTCGPKVVWVPALVAPAQPQTPQLYTTQKVMQSGFNIGLTSYIPPDGPLFPLYEHFDRRNVSQFSPTEIWPNVSLKYGMRWSYFFESNFPLVAI